ncbi:MAG: AAA family ATPase, partial [Maritimibacter sp.]
MNIPANQMELREEEIRAHYDAASGMLEGIDHTPRIGKAKATSPLQAEERSPGIARRSHRFRSTTPGLVTRSTARPEGVRLIERVEDCDGGDPLLSPVQATVLHGLRRALAIALAMGENYAQQTGLVALKKQNL